MEPKNKPFFFFLFSPLSPLWLTFPLESFLIGYDVTHFIYQVKEKKMEADRREEWITKRRAAAAAAAACY